MTAHSLLAMAPVQHSPVLTTSLRRRPLKKTLPSPSGHHFRRQLYEPTPLAPLRPVGHSYATGEASPPTNAVAGAALLCLPPTPPLNLLGLAHW